MSACPQCGNVAKPTDKFCNVCGTPLARTGAQAAQPAPAAPPAPPGYGAPAPAQYAAPPVAPAPAGYGAPAPGYGAMPGQPPMARCPMGHEIAPGASYCAQGHPIALDQMQFASDAYGGAAGGYAAPAGPPQGYAAPLQASPYGAPPAGPPPQAFGAPPGPPGAPGYAQAPYAPPTAPSAFSPPGSPQPYGSAPPAAAMPAPAPAPAPYAGQNDTSRDAAPPRVLRGFLVAYGSNPGGDFWPLTGGRLVVGRQGAEGLDVPLQDPTISSRHAALVVDGIGGGIAVEDTGSTNGTFVNDEHIGFNGRRDLRDGDRIRFGGYTTVVKIIGRI